MPAGTIKKRSVTLAGHRTSFSVEDEFWAVLKAIAAERRVAVGELLAEIDAARSSNLSSAVRLFVLDWLQRRTGLTAQPEN